MGTGASSKSQKKHDQKAGDTSYEAAGTATVVIEIGADGSAILRGADMSEAQQIFVVIDPRAGRQLTDVKCLNDPQLLRKIMLGGGGKTQLKIFLLVPSASSSKAHLMNAHMAVFWMGHWLSQEHTPSFIRTDDYFHNGDAIMKAMVDQGKTVYPAEEVGNMMAVFEAVAKCTWPKRAYVHWPVVAGLEEGEVCAEDILQKIGPIFRDEANVLAGIGEAAPADGVATQAVLASGIKPAFLTFSEETADKFKDGCPDVESFQVTEDIFGLIDSGEMGGELGGLMDETAFPILLAGPNDVAGCPENTQTLFVKFVEKWRETKPCMSLCVVLVDESVDAFKQNLWLVPTLHCLLEAADMVVFATNDELKDAAGFFTKAKYPEADIAKTAMLQLIPFPRLHFYTLGTAVGGAELEDKEILLPGVTVGPPSGAANFPPIDKFKKEDNCFIFPEFPAANHELVIPGAPDFSGASLITPAKLLISIFQGVVQNMRDKCGEEADLTWMAAFGEEFSEDSGELTESASNLGDLCSEFAQYLESSIGCEQELEEE